MNIGVPFLIWKDIVEASDLDSRVMYTIRWHGKISQQSNLLHCLRGTQKLQPC